MHRAVWILALGLICLPACGGGGGAALDEVPAGALVTGKVLTVDGSSASLAGVTVVVPETGSSVQTDAAGQFACDAPSGRTFRIRFEHPDHPGSGGNDLGEHGDETPDGTDIDGDEVEVGPLAPGESCDLEVELEDGEVVEAWLERDGEGHEGHGGEGRLCPPDKPPFPFPLGEVELTCEGDCCLLELEIEGLDGPATYEIVLWHPSGDEMSLGEFVVDAEGVGRFEYEACADDELPFGAEDPSELWGVELLILDAEGEIVLRGKIPGRGPHHDRHDRPHVLWELAAPEGSPEPDAEGAVLVEYAEKCARIVIEVGGIESRESLDVVLVPPEADEIQLGTIEIDETGMGRLVLEYCDEEDLPPIPFNGPEDIFGLVLELRDVAEDVVLRGEIAEVDMPHLPPIDPPSGGMGFLEAPEGSPETDGVGHVSVICAGEFGAMLVIVDRFETAGDYDVVLTCGEADPFTLGTLEVGEGGTGYFVLEVDSDTLLPFEAADLKDLAGCTLDVMTEGGTVVLTGEVPEVRDGMPGGMPGGGGRPH